MSKKIESNRATGKTYRACLMALFKASDGLKVAIQTPHQEAAFDMLLMLMPWEDFVDRARRQISFPNGGRVIVCLPEDFERRTAGIGVDVIHD